MRSIIETVMGIGIGVIILAFVIWFYVFRETPEPVAVDEQNAEAVQGNVVKSNQLFTEILEGSDLSAQLALLNQFEEFPADAETPVKLDFLGKRFKLAQVVLENEGLTELDRVSAAKAAIRAAAQTYAVCRDAGIDTDGSITEDYERMANGYANDKDSELASLARLSQLKLLVYQNLEARLSDYYEQIERDAKRLIEYSSQNRDLLVALRFLADQIDVRDESIGSKFRTAVLDTYQLQDDLPDDFRAILQSIEDQLAVEKTELGILNRTVATTEQFDVYLAKIKQLLDRGNLSPEFYGRLYGAIDFLEVLGEHDKAIQMLNEIGESAKKQSGAASRLIGWRISKFGLLRNQAVGSKLDFSDTDSDGGELENSFFEGAPTIVAFYSPKVPASQTFLTELNHVHLTTEVVGVKVVAIAVEAMGNENDNPITTTPPGWKMLVSIPPKGPSDSEDQLSNIFKQLPVTKVPYLAIVDADRTVRFLNVPFSDLKTKVELLASEARR